MSNGIMQIAPSSFVGEKAKTLPRYSPPLPVPGATAVYSTYNLPQQAGELVTEWPSANGLGEKLTVVGAGSTLVDAKAPRMMADGSVRFSRLNSETLGAPLNNSQPRTVVAVARVWKLQGQTSYLDAIVSSGQNKNALGQVMAVNGSGTARTYAGGSINLTGFGVGTDWHVFISVFDGANSVIRVDNNELIGDAGVHTSSQIVLGSYQSQFSDIEVREVISYPGALSLEDRVTTVEKLKARYGF